MKYFSVTAVISSLLLLTACGPRDIDAEPTDTLQMEWETAMTVPVTVFSETVSDLSEPAPDLSEPAPETLPPANSQPAAPAPEAKPTEAPVAKAEAKPETPAQPVVDEQAVFDEKMDVYIKCYNKLQIPVQRSLARYADWLKDFKQGPTGEERTVYGIYGISESNLAECEKGVKSAVALTPALQPIDGVAVSYIDAAVALSLIHI